MNIATGEKPVIDIGAQADGLGAELSNFPARPFVFRGIQIESMEGLIQGAKFKDIAKQNAVFKLFGKAAKFKGKKSKWFVDQVLFWQGEAFSRHSHQWQELLDEAFEALFTQNATARAALLATGDAELTHSIGKDDPHHTALTTAEFTSRLMRMREQLRSSLS